MKLNSRMPCISFLQMKFKTIETTRLLSFKSVVHETSETVLHNMGASTSTGPQSGTRTYTMEQDEFAAINISNAVLNRLQNEQDKRNKPRIAKPTQPTPPAQQPKPPSTSSASPQTVPDVGSACCCLHAPIQRPTAELAEVQQRLEPIEREYQRQMAEWQRYTDALRRPSECNGLQAQLMMCYPANGQQPLHCAQLAADFNVCLQRHCAQLRSTLTNVEWMKAAKNTQ